MIEITNVSNTDNPLNTSVRTGDEQKEKVIESAVLAKWDSSKLVDCRSVNVSNIFNDEGDFVIEVNLDMPTHIRVPRDLMKKVIYDIYLT